MINQLEFDSELKEFKGKLEFNNKQINITVSNEESKVEDVFRLVEYTFDKIKLHEKIFKEKISEELLELHNNTWNDGELTSKVEFISRIQLKSILFFCDGNAELYYDDGNLFWGHTIAADISEKGQYVAAQIYG